MKFGDNLRNLRKMHKTSQEKLAEKLDVSRQSVSKWEMGESYPEMKHILKICDLFHCKINDLIHENFSDFTTLDKDVQDKVVKFKKDKQQKMQLLSKIMQVIAKIWMFISIASLTLCFILLLQIPSIINDSINIESLLSKLFVISEFEWMIHLEGSNVFIYIAIVLIYGIIISCLQWFLASNLVKVSRNLYVQKTPFILENISKIKQIGLFFIIIRCLDSIFKSVIKSIGTQRITLSFDIMDFALVIIIILVIYIFEYGYEIQLDSPGILFDGEEIDEIDNKWSISYLNKNFFKIITNLFIGVVTCLSIVFGFKFINNVNEGYINYVPQNPIQAPIIITMEELGYQESDVESASMSSDSKGDYYMLTMDNSKKVIYEDEYMSLMINIKKYNDKDIALNEYLSMMTANKKNSISYACRISKDCSYQESSVITTDNVQEFMIELNKEQWNVDQGYVLYNKDNYINYGNSNEYFLLKNNVFIYIELNTPLEFNDDQIKVLSTLFERSEEIFKK